MIKKENIKTQDGKTLTRTYSDTDHKIKNVNTGIIYGEAVDITDSVEYEEVVNEYVELDGPESYAELCEASESMAKVTAKINRINLSDNEALSMKDFYPSWESKIGKTLEAGYITLYDGRLWRARQLHAVTAVYPPGIDTASLYEVIELQHEGTVLDPVPYMPPMEIFADRYYIQNDVLYKCTRDSGTALSHDLSALVGLYVELVNS